MPGGRIAPPEDRLYLYGFLDGAMITVRLEGSTFSFGRKGRFGQPVSKTDSEHAIRWAGVAFFRWFLSRSVTSTLNKRGNLPDLPLLQYGGGSGGRWGACFPSLSLVRIGAVSFRTDGLLPCVFSITNSTLYAK